MNINPEILKHLGYSLVQNRDELIALAEPNWPYSQFEEDSYPCWVKPVETFWNDYSCQELVVFDQITIDKIFAFDNIGARGV
ncbi:hypothetical protein OBDJBBDK_00061 [Aeromonas phage AhFM11]|nr:hypothetical protein OBDJBBDK_00061 [Aeromonas phage AhFM11]